MGAFFRLSDGAEMFYRIDDFTDRWTTPTPVMFVHGFGESHEAWRGYVPHLARRHRVIRIDQRGFGASTPMAADFPWSMERWQGDLVEIIAALAPAGVHLVAAKVGGPVAIAAAALRPDLVKSLTLIGTIVKGADHSATLAHIRELGLRSWLASTMKARLGSDMSDEATQWWLDLMSRTPVSTALGFFAFVPSIDIMHHLGTLRCPVQVIATDSERRPIGGTAAWQGLIPDSVLVPVGGAAYHAAAVLPDVCAALISAFVDRVDAGGGARQVPSRP